MSGELAKKALAINAQDLFEFSPDAILVIDREGRINQANSQVEQLFGYDRKNLLGQPVEVLIPKPFRDAHLAHRREYSEQPQRRPMGVSGELIRLE
jgi:protein-histidine pros-kinase